MVAEGNVVTVGSTADVTVESIAAVEAVWTSVVAAARTVEDMVVESAAVVVADGFVAVCSGNTPVSVAEKVKFYFFKIHSSSKCLPFAYNLLQCVMYFDK